MKRRAQSLISHEQQSNSQTDVDKVKHTVTKPSNVRTSLSTKNGTRNRLNNLFNQSNGQLRQSRRLLNQQKIKSETTETGNELKTTGVPIHLLDLKPGSSGFEAEQALPARRMINSDTRTVSTDSSDSSANSDDEELRCLKMTNFDGKFVYSFKRGTSDEWIHLTEDQINSHGKAFVQQALRYMLKEVCDVHLDYRHMGVVLRPVTPPILKEASTKLKSVNKAEETTNGSMDRHFCLLAGVPQLALDETRKL
ncbi:hypothetical protein M3Y98_00424900 [Aphelenchoides besseyi]|nr:hypothetical protein M3Y98_00424900 [Aphelenchoides besseyi]KAI6202181.1 hypothetical protein M3Y96_00921300 [Aphelenchoides besseyi]